MIRYLMPFLVGVLLLRPLPVDQLQAHASEGVISGNGAATTVATAPATQKMALAEVQKVTVWVTAYASVPNETDNTPFITASNKHVQDGFIAANFLPFGTQVQIPALFGDKIFTVEDRMNRRMVGFVDVWMPTVTDAVNFGIHRTDIIVLGTPSNRVAAN